METVRKTRGKVQKVDWAALVDEAWGNDEDEASECPTLECSESTLSENPLPTRVAKHEVESVSRFDENTPVCGEETSCTPLNSVHHKTVEPCRKLFPVFVNSTPTSVRATTGLEKNSFPSRKRKADSEKLTALKRPKLARRGRNGGKKENLEQLYLDFGQKTLGHVTCKVCGMVYTFGQPDDQSEHFKFHRKFLSGVKFPGWKSERVVGEYPDGRIILVLPTDSKQHLRKVEEIRDLVDNELGYATGTTLDMKRSKVFLYATQKTLVGCVIAEEISEGYQVLTPEGGDTGSNSLDGLSAWFCSTTPQPASVGINRMWVSAHFRRKGVASKLLDSVRLNFVPGYVVPRNKIAFSDPTPDGKAFATKYCRTQNFLVYRWQ